MVEELSYTAVLGLVTSFYDSEASYTLNIVASLLTWARN
jgi:hypothetical protein